jgi:hypothetical protein
MIHTLSVQEVVNQHIVAGGRLHRRVAEAVMVLLAHVLLALAGHMSTEVLRALLRG